ncbi:hypothetical protein BDZ89DRAFT_964627 [Hymenopellis radicata]|nr:hypothetical protein BDZ89DRAFT_964627 [Hymenopellis radicata]
MPPLHDLFIRRYLLFMVARNITNPSQSFSETMRRLNLDVKVIQDIRSTRYLPGREPVLKLGNLHLAWEYAKDSEHHHRFVQMLRMTPESFDILLILIRDHPVFHNDSNNPQAPVQTQLAVTLYCLGRYGNGASVKDVARVAGISEGSEKETEKKWLDDQLGFVGAWRDGWVMYDGTIVVLYCRPDLDGDAYYTRKSNYGLNVQVSFSSTLLLICIYSHTYADWKRGDKPPHRRLCMRTHRVCSRL